jgi:ribonuclease E
MAKKMLIDATHAEETRVVVVDGNKVEEFDFESENKRQLAGNIYLAKVTRVEPSLQAAFVDYGGNRHGFLAFSEIHPDYYQIPVADREALMEEERAYAEAQQAREEEDEKPKSRRRRTRSKAAKASDKDAVETREIEIKGMETIDLDEPSEDEVSDADVVAAAPEAVEAGDAGADDVAEVTATEDGEGVSEEAEAPVAETQEDASAAEAQDDAEPEEGEAPAVEAAEETEEPAQANDEATDEGEVPAHKASAAERDETIESVADDDDEEDIRPIRKPRPKRYKIQEVIKVRQIMLVQVVKEERGNKGAALTTYLSLAGRYCVLMPNTARGGGISRKITNAADRKKLKEIANEIDVPKGAGLIVRTAGAKRTKAEIKRDYEYLQRLWEQIRELTLKSIAPAKIYEEGNLIKRSIRDLYNREIDEVLVEGERGYRVAKDFMKMIMPSHAKNVKHYQEPLPLFARFQVESYLGAMFNPTVQLKSGGYIVIGVTEALVAIDVNSGKATKEGSIEETALKTNLEAAEEVARQLRLRDLAGLIVIDFIDMDERKNNAAVEKRLKDKLKTDRARIQVGRISGFGLLEMSRQRLRPGMIEATTQPCPHCHGTGLLRSDDNVSLAILRQLEEEGVRGRSKEVLVRAPVAIANYLMNQKREHIAMIEARFGLSVRIEGDPSLISPDYAIEKFKTATRVVPERDTSVVSVDSKLMAEIDEEEDEDDISVVEEAAEEEAKPKKKRRRRRRRKGSGNGDQSDDSQAGSEGDEGEGTSDAADEAAEGEVAAEAAPEEEAKPKKSRSRSRSRKKKTEPKEDAPEAEAAADADAAPAEETSAAQDDAPAAEEVAAEVTKAAQAEPVSEAEPAPEPADEAAAEPTPEPEIEAVEETPAAEPEPEQAVAEPEAPKVDEPPKPKRRGWWSIGK